LSNLFTQLLFYGTHQTQSTNINIENTANQKSIINKSKNYGTMLFI
jgi:hypothetical protein